MYLCWQEPGDRAWNGPDLLKSANLLFSSLEPRYLWQYVGVQFSETCCKIPTSTDTNNNENDSVKPVGSGDPLLQEVNKFRIFSLNLTYLMVFFTPPFLPILKFESLLAVQTDLSIFALKMSVEKFWRWDPLWVWVVEKFQAYISLLDWENFQFWNPSWAGDVENISVSGSVLSQNLRKISRSYT